MAAESDICDGNLEISTKNGRSGGTPREKFEAAVNVIQGLPKNGSFQPSHEMMLRFYGYYKQATLGPCSIPQPWAWDVVGRAKWNAWSAMGEMPREEAMLLYVNELKQIIETMPQTDQVAEFIEKLGSFYEIVDERDEPVRSSGRKPAFEGIEKLMARAEIHLNGNGVGSESDSEEDSDKDVDTMEVRETIEHHRVLVTENYASQDSGIGLSESPPKEIHYLPNPEADYNANSKKPRPDRPAHSAHRTNGNHHHQQHYQQQQQQQRSLPTISSDTDSEAEFCDSTDHLGQSTLPTAVGQSGASNGPMSDAIAQRGGGETPDGRSDGRAVDGTRSSSRRGPQNRPTPDQTYLGTPPSLPVGAVGGAAGGEFPGRGGVPTTAHMDPQIAATLLRLQHDMNHILMKLNTLETHVLEQRRNDQAVQRPRTPSWCRWWPFGNLPAKTVVAILAWPVFLQLIFRLFRLVQRRRRKLPR